MPASFARFNLSGAPTGNRPIPVVNVASPGTLIHTAVVGDSAFDEIYLFATNVTGLAVPVTIEWGGTTLGDQVAHSYTIPPNSAMITVVPGLTLNNGLIVHAFAGTTLAINLSGHINRIS